MPGLIGVFCSDKYRSDEQGLREIMDPFALSDVEAIALPEGTLTASHVKNHPLGGKRSYEDQDYAACFAGDLVGVPAIPWDFIMSAFRSGEHRRLCDLRGYYAIVAYDKHRRKICALNDRKGLQPLFYGTVGDGLVVTTRMAAFCRFNAAHRFDKRWLFEQMFFNFAVGETTFLEGVRRLRPGFRVDYDLGSGQIQVTRYADLFRKSERIISGPSAFEKGIEVCKSAIPKYFACDGGEVATALTAGWDSRVVLAFMPEARKTCTTAFTYGEPGCDDIVHAAWVARELGVKHIAIPFDQAFLATFPETLRQHLYINSGSPRVSMGQLMYIYRTLTDGGRRFRSVLSGASADMLFRGHHNIPSIVSGPMDRVFREGRAVIDEAFFGRMFGKGYGEFAEHIYGALGRMREDYGDFGSSATLLSYLTYDAPIGYFLTEATTVNQYSCFRVPFWDDDIVSLAHEAGFGTLGLSRYLTGRPDHYREHQFHARLLLSNPRVGKLSMQGWPVRAFLGPKSVYVFHRAVAAARRRIPTRHRGSRGPQNWGMWADTVLKKTIDDAIFGKDPLVGEYLAREFLSDLRARRDLHWMTKAVTAELVLDLVGKNWRLN